MPFLSHLPELIIVLIVGLLVFGPKRLPEIGNSLAHTIKAFQHSMKEVTSAHDQPANPTPPVALPVPTNEATAAEQART